MKRARQTFRALLAGDSGAATAEFVLVIPILLVLIFGTINMSVMLYAYVQLHYAAADAARCRAVKTTVCSNDTTTAAYATGLLSAPLQSPTFVHSTDLCGNTVTGSATFNVNTGLTQTPVTLSARACYPLQP